ncbi:hypothetical protein [Mucilaginibacter kameinonensis]|uniref:hypothetical protein n=1 Tax=Mucilaginibacter kameinonensis TaxID=452286 RepID=UPI000EF7CDF9|nr:hypothetical protein [Mucilaginibacter kameinonensis]
MITRFAGLYLREEDPDTIYITSYVSRHDFEKKLQLNSFDVISTDYETSKTVAIDKNSRILITTDQNGAGRGMNTSAEIYIKNGEEILLLCNFCANEEVNDLRKTECYKLAEYIANRMKVKYGIEWEYKISVDTPEKEKEFNKNVFIVILTLIVTFILIYYRLKYDIDHPKINYGR